RWRRLYLTSIAGLMVITAPLSGLLVLFAEPLVLTLFGAQWAPSAPIFVALAISILIQPVYTSAGWIYVSLGRTRRLMRAGIVATAWYCSAFLIGLKFGGFGVALAYACSIFFLTPPWLWWATRGTALSLRDIVQIVWPPILSTVGAGVVAVALPSLAGSSILDGAARTAGFLAIYVALLFTTCLLFPSWRRDIQPLLDQASRATVFLSALRLRS
ncbi:MAG TPA: oligosaccharide flippase family protein, partial [Kiloniellales bacterium]